MSYIACNCCPSPKDCAWANLCWNVEAGKKQAEYQKKLSADLSLISSELAKYDEQVARVKEQRASMPIWQPVEKKKIDKPIDCGHNQYSAFGICAVCGFWKK